MKGKPKVQFKTPDNNKIAYGDQRRIPDVECDPIPSAQSRIDSAGFSVSVGQTVDSSCPAGTAAGTNPSGRTIKGGPVEIEVSNGKSAGGPVVPGQPGTPTRPPRRR
jgi:beta-lactam-binding protein with PASTA domain